ncbi:MAG TPA: TrkA family potassium uptake protein [Acidimicrobiia bacterium]
MHVIVVGCGRVGSELAVSLDQGGHSVAIMDKNQVAFRKLPDGWGGRTVHGFGFDRDHLEAAGVHEAGALAAVTSGDNSNILAARIARETFEIPRVVARIYDPRRALIYQRLGIATVATVTWTTDQVMRRLFEDNSVTEWSEPSGQVVLVERALPDGWAGQPLAPLSSGDRFRLVSMTRSGQAQLAGNDLIGQEGDLLHIAVRKDALDELSELLSRPPTSSTH